MVFIRMDFTKLLSIAKIAVMAAILLTLFVPRVITLYANQVTHPGAVITLELKVSATDTESTECHFVLGSGKASMVWMTYPNSDLCTYMRARVGQRLRIVVTPLGD